MMWVTGFVCVVTAYLVGAVPFGLLVGRMKGIDIRQHGSGNIGATNVGRVLGRKFGLTVFALDLLKGLLPVLIAGRLLSTRPGEPGQAAGVIFWVLVATAGILGHMFPVYLGFKGGKGVATSLGVLLGIYPYYTLPGVIVFAIWATVTWITRYVSVGSVAAAGAFPIIFAIFVQLESWGGRYLWPLYLFAVMVAVLVIYRHRGNLKRLREGTESRIGNRKPAPGVVKEA